MVVTVVFVLGALVAGISALAANLMSSRPHTWRSHLQGLARLGVFGGCMAAIGRVVMYGDHPRLENAILMASLAALYLVQARHEVLRQRGEIA